MAALNPLDVIVVGAGYSGLHILHSAAKLGFKVKGFERSPRSGGVWYSNAYPGARADVESLEYQFSDPAIWKTFTFTEKYPGRDEVLRYFDHVMDVWKLADHLEFNTDVVAARFNEQTNLWTVTLADKRVFVTRWLIWAIGFASKTYVPDYKGLDQFKGKWYHTANWPEGGVDVKGKRVGVIGNGATGVQLIQEIAPIVGHLSVFQRTPSTALPIHHGALDPAEEQKKKDTGVYEDSFRRCRTTFFGSTLKNHDGKFADSTPEERRALYEKLYAAGGLHLIVSNFQEILISEDANREVYDFWAQKARERITDDKKREILVPLQPVNPIATKNPTLESQYYETLNRSNVDVFDVSSTGTPIKGAVSNGLELSSGVVDLDILILATGFNAFTGATADIDVVGLNGVTLKNKWEKEGVKSYLGISLTEFPNMFFSYGAQSPAAVAVGTTHAEVQSEWFQGFLTHLRDNAVKRVEVKQEPVEQWTGLVSMAWNATLFSRAKTSWFLGSNVPGKFLQPLNFLGGIATYTALLGKETMTNYESYVLTK